MGRRKATLPLTASGPTFLGAITATLSRASIDEIRIVVAPDFEPLTSNLTVNPEPSRGMLSSVQCGLRAMRGDVEAVLVWPVDHPLVSETTIRQICDGYRATAAPVVVPTHSGRRGHPVLFASRVFPELFAADPSEGARAVVHAHADRIELPVSDAEIVEDIDTPVDYERIYGSRR